MAIQGIRGVTYKAKGQWKEDPITEPQIYRIHKCQEYLKIDDPEVPPNTKGEASNEIECLFGLMDLMHEYHIDIIHNPEQYIYETIQYRGD